MFSRLARQDGFTLIEVLVAMVLLLGGVAATVTMMNTANASTETNQARNGATNIVRDIIEAARAVPYDKAKPTLTTSGAVDTTLQTAIQAMGSTAANATGSSLADADTATAGWQIRRRAITYTITLKACVVDDAKDSVSSSHSPADAGNKGYFCSNLPTSPVGDSNPDDYRRVAVTASWSKASCGACATSSAATSQQFSVTQTGLIINPNGGLGPAPVGSISGPTGEDPCGSPGAANAQCTLNAGGSGCSINCGLQCTRDLTYTATFQDSATGAVFTVNDPAHTQQTVTTGTANAAAGTITYTFTWPGNAAPPDNTYTLAAQAFNSSGEFGRQLFQTVIVNCGPPSGPPLPPAPSGLGGCSGGNDAATGCPGAGGFNWRRCVTYPANTPSCGSNRIFEIEWSPPNPANDVIGYEVFKVNGQPDFNNTSGQGSDPLDTLLSCRGRTGTTTMPGPSDFLEPSQPSCWDENLDDQPFPVVPSVTGGVYAPGVRGQYYVEAVDPANASGSGTPRANPGNHSALITVTENELNVRPTPPVLNVQTVNGLPCLSWSNSTDLDVNNASLTSPIRFYRIYRDSNLLGKVSDGNGGQIFDVPYTDRIGRSLPNQGTSCDTTNPGLSFFSDSSAGASSWTYWVTAVDANYLESFPSNASSWTPPGP